MKILPIIGCLECLHRQRVYGGYFCRSEQKHIIDLISDYPDWCPLEDYKPEMMNEAEKDLIVKAFIEILDGNYKWHDIQYSTGLPKKRCEEIEQLFKTAFKKGGAK